MAVIVALIVGAAFFGGYRVGARPAASTRYAYTLRVGGRVTVPAVKLACGLLRQHHFLSNAGREHPVLFCGQSPPGPQVHHQVDFLRNGIQVWKVGITDHPVWSGTP